MDLGFAKIRSAAVPRMRASLKAGIMQKMEGHGSERGIMAASCQKKTPPGKSGGEYFELAGQTES